MSLLTKCGAADTVSLVPSSSSSYKPEMFKHERKAFLRKVATELATVPEDLAFYWGFNQMAERGGFEPPVGVLAPTTV
jgi:hypothetical protein